MNASSGALLDVGIHVVGQTPTHRLIRQHLLRMGGRQVNVGNAEVFVCDADDPRSFDHPGLVCALETVSLDNGALVGSESTAQAALGLPDFVGPSGGRPDRCGADIASSVAAFLAVQTICATRFGHVDGGAGERFVTSPLRALGLLKSLCFAGRSRPDEWIGTHVRSREKGEDVGYSTADGRVTLDFPENNEDAWRGYCVAMGLPESFIETKAHRYMQTVGWGDDVDEARPIYEAALSGQTTSEAMQAIIRHGGSSVPFLTVDECLAHPQAAAVGLDQSYLEALPFQIDAPGGPASANRPSMEPGKPLTGLRVVDFGIGGVGPFAPMILARLGADVVKVEPPFDFVHTIGPWADEISTTYLSCNTAKRSISLNLKNDADRAALLELVAGADVVNANFRPGALERLGVGFEDLVAVNPTVILATTTGYGWAGPLADQPCTDPHAQAFAGFAALNRRAPHDHDRRCRYVGFIDVVTSAVIAEGICAALLVRDQAGGPVHMQTSMMHAVCESAQTVRDGTAPCAPDDIYRAADGYFALTCRTETEWATLLSLLDKPVALAGPSFDTAASRYENRDELRRILEHEFVAKACLAWVLGLARGGIPAVRVIDDDEALARADYRRLGLVVPLEFGEYAPVMVGGNAVVFDGGERTVLRAPVPGEHHEDFIADPAAFWLDPTASTAP